MPTRSLGLPGTESTPRVGKQNLNAVMSADLRALNAAVAVSSQRRCCGCPNEGSGLGQHNRAFADILVGVKRGTKWWCGTCRSRHATNEVHKKCLLACRVKPRSFFAIFRVQIDSPTSFTCFGTGVVRSADSCLLDTDSRFTLFVALLVFCCHRRRATRPPRPPPRPWRSCPRAVRKPAPRLLRHHGRPA